MEWAFDPQCKELLYALGKQTFNLYLGSQGFTQTLHEKRLNTILYIPVYGLRMPIYGNNLSQYGKIRDRIQAFFALWNRQGT